MAIDRSKPARPTGTRSRASKTAKAEKAQRRTVKGQEKFRVLAYVLPMVKNGMSHKEAWRFATQAVEDDELAVGKLRGYQTVHNWIKWALQLEEDEGRALTVEDCRPRKKSGRPPMELHPDLLEYWEDQILWDWYFSVASLIRDVQGWAEKNGYEVPSEAHLRARYDRTDVAKISAARHGRRAARMDAVPHSAVPTDFTHEVWTLDEKDSPVAIQYFHPRLKRLVSVYPKLILMADNHSRVILSFHVAEPFKDGSDAVGVTEAEVTGTFFSACIPELASQGCRPFSGFLPHTVRLDKAGAHNDLKGMTKKHGLDVPKLPGASPPNRGSIERVIGSVAGLLDGFKGHENKWVPMDRVDEAEAAKREAGALRKNRRFPRRSPIAVGDLMTMKEYSAALADRFEEYNLRHHRMIGCSPDVSYFQQLDRSVLRLGRDAISMLKPRTLTVTKDGLEHRNKVFAAVAGDEFMRVGQQLQCRVDPLLRAMWAEVGDRQWLLWPKDVFARMNAAEDVARKRAAGVQEYSEQAAEALSRRLADLVGEESAEETEYEYAEVVGDDFRPDLRPGRNLTEEDLAQRDPPPKTPRKNTAKKPVKETAQKARPPKAPSRSGFPKGIVTNRRKHLKLLDGDDE